MKLSLLFFCFFSLYTTLNATYGKNSYGASKYVQSYKTPVKKQPIKVVVDKKDDYKYKDKYVIVKKEEDKKEEIKKDFADIFDLLYSKKDPVKGKKYCELECNDLGVSQDGNWLTKLDKISIEIAYNKKADALAIINKKLKLAAVLVKGYFGLFDLTMNVGLIFKASNGYATMVNGISQLSYLLNGIDTQVMAAIEYLALNVISSAKSKLDFGVSSLVFNFANFFTQGASLGVNLFLSTLTGGSIQFSLNMINFFTSLFKFYTSGVLDSSLGIVNIIGGLFAAESSVLASAFSSLSTFFLNSIALSSNTMFSLVYNLTYFLEGMVKNTIKSALLSDMNWNFYGANREHLFACGLNGLILRNGLAVSTMETWGSVNANVHLEGYIKIESSAYLNIN